MKLDFEKLEDIMTVGESKAAQENRRFRVYLQYAKPIEEPLEEGELMRSLGIFVQFRPKKERVSAGMFDREADVSEISTYWEVKNEKTGEWNEGDLGIGFMDLIKDRPDEFIKQEFIIKVNGTTYASYKKFAKDFGLTELVPVTAKIPKPLALKLTRITEEEGETSSWRLRLLVQEYLTEQIKDRVRRVLFSD